LEQIGKNVSAGKKSKRAVCFFSHFSVVLVTARKANWK